MSSIGIEDTLTPQEHILLGSTSDETNFYIPVVLQKGLIIKDRHRPDVLFSINTVISEVNEARKYFKYFLATIGHFRNVPKYAKGIVKVKLSPLNLETGETIRDPRPIDENLKFDPESISDLRLRK
jgi:hypothetical protein